MFFSKQNAAEIALEVNTKILENLLEDFIADSISLSFPTIPLDAVKEMVAYSNIGEELMNGGAQAVQWTMKCASIFLRNVLPSTEETPTPSAYRK
jgi:hypothetical protein